MTSILRCHFEHVVENRYLPFGLGFMAFRDSPARNDFQVEMSMTMGGVPCIKLFWTLVRNVSHEALQSDAELMLITKSLIKQIWLCTFCHFYYFFYCSHQDCFTVERGRCQLHVHFEAMLLEWCQLWYGSIYLTASNKCSGAIDRFQSNCSRTCSASFISTSNA